MTLRILQRVLYDELSFFTDTSQSMHDLIKSHAKKPETIDRVIDRYSIAGINSPAVGKRGYVKRWDGMKNEKGLFSMYLDTSQGFVLCYDGAPGGLVGFKPILGGLRIKQIQGVRSYRNGKRRGSRGLAKIEWEQMLVSYVEEFARTKGLSKVVIDGGAGNRWIGDSELSVSRAIQRYDTTASKMGYQLTLANNWKKIIG